MERGRRRGKGGSCHQTISFECLGKRNTKDGWEQREGYSSSVRGCLDTGWTVHYGTYLCMQRLRSAQLERDSNTLRPLIRVGGNLDTDSSRVDPGHLQSLPFVPIIIISGYYTYISSLYPRLPRVVRVDPYFPG